MSSWRGFCFGFWLWRCCCWRCCCSRSCCGLRLVGSFMAHSMLEAAAGMAPILLLFSLIFLENLGLFFIIGVVLIAGLLLYEHSIVRPDDLSRVNVAFFNVNGIISIGLMIITIIDIIY